MNGVLDSVREAAEAQEETVEETASLMANINGSMKNIRERVQNLSHSADESASSIVQMGSSIDEVARSALRDARQKITEGLESNRRTRENHLIWAAPGTGKTYFVEQVAAALPSSVGFLELNLAKHDQERFSADLREVEHTEQAHICFVDEIDAKPQEAGPYEILLPYLDAAVQAGLNADMPRVN